MRTAPETRQRIVERAADAFSLTGYAGTSMSELAEASGLEKGGVYNHFESKDALAVAAFDHAWGRVWARVERALAGRRTATTRLRAVIGVYRDLIVDPPLPGGCPLLNTAVEADDAHPLLRARARVAAERWRDLLEGIAGDGVAAGELDPATDPKELATVLMATLEGAVMLSKLFGSRGPMHRAVNHLSDHVESLVAHHG